MEVNPFTSIGLQTSAESPRLPRAKAAKADLGQADQGAGGGGGGGGVAGVSSSTTVCNRPENVPSACGSGAFGGKFKESAGTLISRYVPGSRAPLMVMAGVALPAWPASAGFAFAAGWLRSDSFL
jgi:hypothetical protein